MAKAEGKLNSVSEAGESRAESLRDQVQRLELQIKKTGTRL